MGYIIIANHDRKEFIHSKNDFSNWHSTETQYGNMGIQEWILHKAAKLTKIWYTSTENIEIFFQRYWGDISVDSIRLHYQKYKKIDIENLPEKNDTEAKFSF